MLIGDIDLLPPQLIHDRVDSGTIDPHTGAYRVHIRIDGADCQLRPAARLPGDAHDLHRAVLDLRHLRLKQPLDQLRMGTAYKNPRSFRCILHFQDIYLNSLRGSEPLDNIYLLQLPQL